MSVIDDIKSRLDIVEVVSNNTSLQKSGQTFKANCPFHQERTPSFFVFPDRQTWRCFGACASGGDIFAFVMKSQNIEFREALKFLAQQANIELPTRETDSQTKLLLEINNDACTYFRKYLDSSRGTNTKEYLKERDINNESLSEFELGLSPSDGQSLKNHLIGRGYNLEDLISAGVVRRQDNQIEQDIFRGRLIIPIRNSVGELVGFGGRTLNDTGPKYLNSPRTPLFDKSKLLYGLNIAKQWAKTEGLVIVEGYMDTITAHQNGFKNVTASMGTALTEHQVTEVRKLTGQIVMSLDADNAGKQATLRSLESSWKIFQNRSRTNRSQNLTSPPSANEENLNLKIAVLPDGQDPDEVIKSSPEKWSQFINDSVPIFEYLLHTLTTRVDIESPQGKAWVAQNLSGFITSIPEPIEQDHHLQLLAKHLSINEDVARASITRNKGFTSSPEKRLEYEGDSAFTKLSTDPIEEYYISWILQHPNLIKLTDIALPEYFSRWENKELIKAMMSLGQILDTESGISKLNESIQPELLTRVELLANKKLPELDKHQRIAAINSTLHRLQERQLREIKIEESIRFSEITTEPLDNNDNQSALYTNEKLRKNEMLRNS